MDWRMTAKQDGGSMAQSLCPCLDQWSGSYTLWLQDYPGIMRNQNARLAGFSCGTVVLPLWHFPFGAFESHGRMVLALLGKTLSEFFTSSKWFFPHVLGMNTFWGWGMENSPWREWRRPVSFPDYNWLLNQKAQGEAEKKWTPRLSLPGYLRSPHLSGFLSCFPCLAGIYTFINLSISFCGGQGENISLP